jgi:serine/threonine protein kinase
MNLDSGTKIGRYEILSLLGAGGMGEVYRARDSQLEREVALKFLKHTDDTEKLRRFRQEAKAVSALNHPNILTIYEVGEYENYHFIVSELVSGENLRAVINEKKLSLNEILDVTVQIGNALASAHALGIVHRDIKPENLMILPDGYVKVLDFGLAKFTGADKNLTDDSDAQTASLIQTKAGMILGTVNYMSPEQLRGKPIDERTDIWSLGIVLFEMLTQRRPFVGETVSDVIAAVLERDVPPLAELRTTMPREVETIIAKSLAKKADDRFRTARELVVSLKNAKSNLASESYAAFDKQLPLNTFHSQKTIFTDVEKVISTNEENLSGLFIGGTKIRWRVLAFLGLILLTTIGVAGWFYVYKPLVDQPAAKQIKIRPLTSKGNIKNAALSPDGQFIVYVQDNSGMQSLWLRRVDKATATALIPESQETYAGVVFSPDGSQIYYTVFDRNGSGKLKRIEMFGSTPQEIVADIDSTAAFAPDGKNFVFIRSAENVNRIILSNTDSGQERILSEKKRPEFYSISSRESLAWSPDGKFIACPFGKTLADSEFMSVLKINAETGEETVATETKWNRVGRVVWTKSADELLITAAEAGSEIFQIWKLSLSNGKTQNVTNSLTDYYNLSLNKDSTLLLGVEYKQNSGIFTASSEQPSQINPILGGGNYDGIGGVRWTADKHIIYVSTESGNRDVWMMDADGSNRRQLTNDKAADDFPSVSNDGKHIAFVSTRVGVPHIWRMNSSGGNLKQLTNKGGENLPTITPDGSSVIYSSRTDNLQVLWRVSIEGGEPVQLTKEQTNWSSISPDGKLIACLTRGTSFESPTQIAVISAETGEFVKTFKPAGELGGPGLPIIIRWTSDGQSIAYVADSKGVSNVWTQNIKGGEPKKLTDFTADKIFSFDWSNDGKNLVYARGGLRNDLVLIENF